MINKYKEAIKKIRIERGLSQSIVADKLGISRPSYIAIEQGKRDLGFLEAQKLAGLLGVTLKEFENGMVPNYEKYKQMILAYLKSEVSIDGKIPKTKLAKLLYLADFAWFYNNFESMSGMQYRRNHFGPVPDMYFRAIDELECEGKISIKQKDDTILISTSEEFESQPSKELSGGELALIGNIAKKWKGKRTAEIVNFTHQQLPYALCGPDEIIPYELIIQEDPGHVY